MVPWANDGCLRTWIPDANAENHAEPGSCAAHNTHVAYDAVTRELVLRKHTSTPRSDSEWNYSLESANPKQVPHGQSAHEPCGLGS